MLGTFSLRTRTSHSLVGTLLVPVFFFPKEELLTSPVTSDANIIIRFCLQKDIVTELAEYVTLAALIVYSVVPNKNNPRHICWVNLSVADAVENFEYVLIVGEEEKV